MSIGYKTWEQEVMAHLLEINGPLEPPSLHDAS